MASRIDPSKPADDERPSKADLRRNLAFARDELNHGGFFVPVGTGATERTVEDKLRDLVSVKDFGAVGDDSDDDAAAIQAAIDAGSGVVLAPPGQYRIGAPIVLRGQTLLAKGANFAPTRDFPSEGGAASSLLRVSDNRTAIVGCSLRGGDPDDARRAGHGVWLDPGVNRVQLEDMYIAGVKADGVHGESSNWMSRFENIRCDTVDIGFHFPGTNNTTLSFQNCYCAGSRTGFAFRQVLGFVLLACAVDQSSSYALTFDASVGTILGSDFEGCRQALHLSSGHTRVTMTGCAYTGLGDAEGSGPKALFDLQNGHLIMEGTRFVNMRNFEHFLDVPDWGSKSVFRDNTISVLGQRNAIMATQGVVEIHNGVTTRSDGAIIGFGSR
jgi:hypothetical protein